jgi:DNA-directed RNA polymerase subunit omega
VIPIATIDELLSKVDSKYTLVHLSARRAREINDYYHSLGEGLGQYTPPLVDQVDSNKPLSIALEEIARRRSSCSTPATPSAPPRRCSARRGRRGRRGRRARRGEAESTSGDAVGTTWPVS